MPLFFSSFNSDVEMVGFGNNILVSDFSLHFFNSEKFKVKQKWVFCILSFCKIFCIVPTINGYNK